jgi:hypothetical protein
MLDLKDLSKFCQVSRSFYWVSGRRQLYIKFYKKEIQSQFHTLDIIDKKNNFRDFAH